MQLCILFFICLTWCKFNKNMNEFGSEMVDAIFMIGLLIATLYYFGITIWSYVAYKRTTTTYVELGAIFIFGVLTMTLLLLKIY